MANKRAKNSKLGDLDMTGVCHGYLYRGCSIVGLTFSDCYEMFLFSLTRARRLM